MCELNSMPEYVAYINAQARCARRPGEQDYADYAGRGIRFLFTSFGQFLAEVGLKPSPAHLLDRIDNDGNYAPGNVRWATASDSAKNKRMTVARITHLTRISPLGAAVAKQTGQAATIAHLRWHVNRGIVKEGCDLCQ